MNLIELVKIALEKKQNQIKERGEVSGTNWGEFRAINIKGDPITLMTPITDLKFGIQALQSGITPVQIPFRIDNSNHYGDNNSFPHEHSGALMFNPYPIKCKVFGEVLSRFSNGLGGFPIPGFAIQDNSLGSDSVSFAPINIKNLKPILSELDNLISSSFTQQTASGNLVTSSGLSIN